MFDTFVRARVSRAEKAVAMENAKALGVGLSSAIRMVIHHLAVHAELPAKLMQQNPKKEHTLAESTDSVELTEVDDGA